MTTKLFITLYVGLVISMIVLIFTNFLMTWVLFAFFFLAVFGGLFLINRPQIIALAFLIVSLIVLGAGLLSQPYNAQDWVTMFVGGSMAVLSAVTLVRTILHPPEIPAAQDERNAAYRALSEPEFLHKVSVETEVNIELLKELYQNDEFWTLIKAGDTIKATKLLRTVQPGVELSAAKMVVDAFSARTA